jgi:pyruvate/2-oxoglutarate dehydrogenase complex dihydrolipoamide acyltransferase (E2) component
MNLDEAQRKKLAAWIAEGLKLSEIQNRLASELGISMTYMEIRLLVDDLKLTPKDTEPLRSGASPFQSAATPPPPGRAHSAPAQAPPAAAPAEAVAGAGRVSVSVDQIARPGAVVSGKVTFGDGNKAEWYFDEMGRLGLAPQQQGYRPPAAELQQFQAALEKELSRLGF